MKNNIEKPKFNTLDCPSGIKKGGLKLTKLNIVRVASLVLTRQNISYIKKVLRREKKFSTGLRYAK